MYKAQRDFLDCVMGEDHYETCPLHNVEDGSESSDHEYRSDGRVHPFFLIVHLLRAEGCSCLSLDLKEYWAHELGDNGNEATRQLLGAYKLEMRGQPLNASIQHSNLERGVVALAAPVQDHTMRYRYGECTSENIWDRHEDGEAYWNEQDLCEIAFDLPRDAERRFKRFLVDFDNPVIKMDHGKVGYTYVIDASTKGVVPGPPRFVPPSLAIFDCARRMQFSRPSDAQPSWHLYTNALSCD